jgi:DNA mismatch repair ATPase MutS
MRSLGLAQLMMQAGMFAPAETFSADVRDGVFTQRRAISMRTVGG